MKVYFTTIKDKTADKIPYNSFYPSRLFRCYKHISCKAVFFFYNPQIPPRTERFSVTHKAKQGMLRRVEAVKRRLYQKRPQSPPRKHATVFKLLYMNCKRCAQGFGQGVANIGRQLILRVTLASEE